MLELADKLTNAVEHHTAGNLAEAETIYREILRVDAGHADALHLLGVAASGQQRHGEAARYIRQAIEIDDSAAVYHFNLGNTLLADGSPADALSCHQRAVALQPGEAAYRINLANTYASLDRIDEAIDIYEQAIPLDRQYEVEIRLNLGQVLKSHGRFAEALTHYKFALERMPPSGDLCTAVGFVLQALGRKEEAEQEYRRALQFDPHCVDAHNNLATLLHENRQLDEAGEHYRQAMRLQPDLADACCNLGLLLTEQRQLGVAAQTFERALTIDPGHIEARFYRGVLRLLGGDFSRGWPDYACRWERKTTRSQRPDRPAWNGVPLREERLLVYAEQGVGDQILFASCLPDVLARARDCVIECDPRLVPLFSRSFPAADVVPERSNGEHQAASTLNEIDMAAALGDLPGMFRLTAESFPRHNGYLIPDAAACRCWRSRLAETGTGPKIGISWRGGSDPEDRQRRSTTLGQWGEVLGNIPSAVFVNLQYGETTEEVAAAHCDWGVRLYDWPQADSLKDLDQFAALLSSLDLVISVDNTTAHLAGALGVPVWTLLQFSSEWRWLAGRDDSPWYPSMKLFRQSSPGNWDDVFRCVCQELHTRFPLNESLNHVLNTI